MKVKTPADKRIAQILNAKFPWIEVWETRGLDSLDVHAVDVESLRDLAEAASRDALDVIETALLVFEEAASEATEWADRHEFLVLGSMRRSVSSALKTPDQYGEVLKIVGDAVTAELAQAPVDWSVVAGELVKVYQP